MKTVDIVISQFVDFAIDYEEWDKVKKLSKDEVQVLFEIVKAAGFNPKRIMSGELKGNYLDQDGSKTGETYSINTLCPFKVVDQEGDDDYHATGWLDSILQCVVRNELEGDETREQLIKEIRLEVKRSVPLKPIQLTPEGDFLCENFPIGSGREYFVDHTRDNHKLEVDECVGVHMYCDGEMYRRGATSTHDVIICEDCHLRVLFPKKVKTYGGLRRELVTQHASVST